MASGLDRVFDVPCPEKTSPAEFRRIRNHVEGADFPLQERLQSAEAGLAQPSGSRVVIGLESLEPPSHADLMNSFGDLEIVRIGEEIPAIPHVGSVVGSRRGDRSQARRGDPAADDNSPRSLSGHKGKAGRERSPAGRSYR